MPPRERLAKCQASSPAIFRPWPPWHGYYKTRQARHSWGPVTLSLPGSPNRLFSVTPASAHPGHSLPQTS